MTKQFETKAKIEVLDVRPGADGCKTGKGAAFLSLYEAKADFNARKKALAVPKGEGDFLFDLYVGDEIVDTIEITTEGYRAVLGESPKTVKQNVAFDRKFWKQAERTAKMLDQARVSAA